MLIQDDQRETETFSRVVKYDDTGQPSGQDTHSWTIQQPQPSLESPQERSLSKLRPPYSPSLHRFFRKLHEANIKAIEWGTGLNIAMGVPVVSTNHMFIVRFSQYEKAQEFALLCGLTEHVPSYNHFFRVGELARWYCIPDHPTATGTRDTPLLLLHDQHVPIDMERVRFQREYLFWRPGLVESIRSYIHFACLPRKNDGRISLVQTELRWISEIVLYTICGVKYLPKCEVENEVSDDPHWEVEGLRRLESLDWAEDDAWLRETLRALVKGEFDYANFNSDWWDSVVAGHAKKSVTV